MLRGALRKPKRLRSVFTASAAAAVALLAAAFAGVSGPEKAEAEVPALQPAARTALLSVSLSATPSTVRPLAGALARVEFVITVVVGDDDEADIILDWGDGTPPLTRLRDNVRRYNDGVSDAHFYAREGRYTPRLTVRLYRAGTTGTTAVVVTILPSFELSDNVPVAPLTPSIPGVPLLPELREQAEPEARLSDSASYVGSASSSVGLGASSSRASAVLVSAGAGGVRALAPAYQRVATPAVRDRFAGALL